MQRQRTRRDRFPSPLAWGLADLAEATGDGEAQDGNQQRSLPTVAVRMASAWLQLIAARRTPASPERPV